MEFILYLKTLLDVENKVIKSVPSSLVCFPLMWAYCWWLRAKTAGRSDVIFFEKEESLLPILAESRVGVLIELHYSF